jgi:hypothetical protein
MNRIEIQMYWEHKPQMSMYDNLNDQIKTLAIYNVQYA